MTPKSRFDPGKYSMFVVEEPTMSGDEVVLRYQLNSDDPDLSLKFEERIEIPNWSVFCKANLSVAKAMAQILAVCAAPSYYKIANPHKIRLYFAPSDVISTQGPHSRNGAFISLVNGLFTDGLGEYAYLNNLDVWSNLDIEIVKVDSPEPSGKAKKVDYFPDVKNYKIKYFADEPKPDTPSAHSFLVPIGGGKDSLVTYQSLKAEGFKVIPFCVNEKPPTRRLFDVMDERPITVSRHIDQQIQALNERGALNGHVPITALMMIIAACVAEANSINFVAFSNEKSSSAGNLNYLGNEINHQWSKSLDAEDLMRGAIRESKANVEVFSMLRPFSELHVMSVFSELKHWHPMFTSCNRAYVQDQSQRVERWCGLCPKCAFVLLGLSPFLSREELAVIFGSDLFEVHDIYQHVEEMVGIRGAKPFECVGEIAECRALLLQISQMSEYGDHEIIQQLSNKLDSHGYVVRDVSEFIGIAGDFRIPPVARPALEWINDAGLTADANRLVRLGLDERFSSDESSSSDKSSSSKDNEPS